MAVEEQMDKTDKQNLDAVATVVASYAQRADVSADQIIDLAQRLMPVFGTATDLHAAGTATATLKQNLTGAPAKGVMTPAVPLSQAVNDDKVTCLCCGKSFTMLKRHLKAEHGLTEEEYRQIFALPEDFPLVAPKYSERKAAYAKQAGLGKYRRETGAKEGLEAR